MESFRVVESIRKCAASRQPLAEAKGIEFSVTVETDPGTVSGDARRFEQVGSSMARLHRGTGLGLAICAQLVRLLGGEIHMHSTWGKGNTFTVTLPVKGQLQP